MAKIILITGPSGAGKSSIARQFLETQTDSWAYISQDDIRQLVLTGYASADGLRSTWNEQTRCQWEASIALCAVMAKEYKKCGINCVIDFYATKHEYETRWKKELEGIDTQLFVLLPSLEVVLARNSLRTSLAKLHNDKVKECYEDFSDWRAHPKQLIDNSDLDIERVAGLINERLRNG